MNLRRAIVVLGCRVDARGTATPALVRRLETALEQWQEHPEAILVVSGGAWGDRPSEAHVMEAWLVGQGVPADHIVREPMARHTLDNAMQVVPLLLHRHINAMTLVTERYHVRRSLHHVRFALRKHKAHGIHVDAVAAPDRLAWPGRGAMAMRELFALARDVLLRSDTGL